MQEAFWFHGSISNEGLVGRQKNINKSKYYKGRRFGDWALVRKLGAGGNGYVWEVSKPDVKNHAIKILKSVQETAFERFKSEIDVISKHSDIGGIIEIVDKYIPDKIGDGKTPWFVMPIATEFVEYRKGKTHLQIANDFLLLARTLSKLHKKDIAHRDIKPANILFYKDRLCFSDFGLVKYPSRKNLTPKRQDVGPKFTMAPEMRREAERADGLAADIYSLAKTLWIALTKRVKGFDGQYSPDGILSLKKYCPDLYTTKLDALLVRCTDNDPLERPAADEFIEQLEHWIELNNDFHERNLQEWLELQNKLFPMGAPFSARWEGVDAICAVLNELSRVKSLNHMFYPNGGGMTLLKAMPAKEEHMILLLTTENSGEILKPKKLTYEAFDADPQWNYFRLECEEIPASGIPNAVCHRGISEDLLELQPGKYVSISNWQNSSYQGNPLPKSARPVQRFLKGSFVMFSTRSVYNQTPETYDARHNTMNEAQFREHISKAANRIR